MKNPSTNLKAPRFNPLALTLALASGIAVSAFSEEVVKQVKTPAEASDYKPWQTPQGFKAPIAETLPNSPFVQVWQGHIYKNGQRLRIWSTQGNFLAKNHADLEREVKRLADLGFNGIRVAGPCAKDIDQPYKKGDLSVGDRMDYLLAMCSKYGVNVWSDLLSHTVVTAAECDAMDAPEECKKALKTITPDGNISFFEIKPLAVIWDKHLESLYQGYLRRTLNHVNQHTGMRYADDPVFAIWELTNEEWWLQRMLSGQFHTLPQYFQKELYGFWTQWLKDKYGSNEKLKEAWMGLLPGESLEQGILFLPILGDQQANNQAKMLGIGIDYQKITLSPRNFNGVRGGDVVQFLSELQIAHKMRSEMVFRSQGKPGQGAAVVPLVWDTGYSFSPESLYVNQHANSIAVGCYITMLTTDPQHPRFPFRSGLEELPRLYYDNPWLEHNRVEGKPTFIYENMIFSPTPYRVEYPLRLVALAAIQDWDVIDFHYYGHPIDDMATSPRPFSEKDPKGTSPENNIQYPTAHIWQGVIYRQDESFMTQVKLAGEIFKNGLLQPAPKPTTITFSVPGLWDLNMVEYGRYAPWLAPTTYRYGLRIAFDAKQKKPVSFDGPVVKGREYMYWLTKPTDQITYDTKRGLLILDSPGVKSVVGFVDPSQSFKNDVVFGDIRLTVPKDLPYPPSQPYAALTLVATDGKPLAESTRILFSTGSAAQNRGFELNLDKWPNGTTDDGLPEFVNVGDGLIRNYGQEPILARVSCSLKAPFLQGMKYRLFDWGGLEIEKGVVEKDSLGIPAEKKVFYVEFTK